MKTIVATAMSRVTDPEAATDELVASLADRLQGSAPTLVVVFASPAIPLAELAPRLGARFGGATVLGASTAGEFTEHGDAKGSVVAFALSGDFRVSAGMSRGLKSDSEAAVRRATESLAAPDDAYPHSTTLVLIDPLAGSSEATTLLVAAALGDGSPIAGGAAGDDLRMTETAVSLGANVASDAVVVARIHSKRPLGLGVAHGHHPISQGLRVTRAEGAVVHEIEGRPAWDVWRDETRAAARAVAIDVDTLEPAAEGAFLLRFEAGLTLGEGYKIRAPLSRSGGAIHFATEVPEGSLIRIMESVPEAQIDSAREAAKRARASLGGGSVAGAIVFDCICRNLILGPDYRHAVTGIRDELGGAPLAGFETYGEIALDEREMSGFHNTTSVVLAFPET